MLLLRRLAFLSLSLSVAKSAWANPPVATADAPLAPPPSHVEPPSYYAGLVAGCRHLPMADFFREAIGLPDGGERFFDYMGIEQLTRMHSLLSGGKFFPELSTFLYREAFLGVRNSGDNGTKERYAWTTRIYEKALENFSTYPELKNSAYFPAILRASLFWLFQSRANIANFAERPEHALDHVTRLFFNQLEAFDQELFKYQVRRMAPVPIAEINRFKSVGIKFATREEAAPFEIVLAKDDFKVESSAVSSLQYLSRQDFKLVALEVDGVRQFLRLPLDSPSADTVFVKEGKFYLVEFKHFNTPSLIEAAVQQLSTDVLHYERTRWPNSPDMNPMVLLTNGAFRESYMEKDGLLYLRKSNMPVLAGGKQVLVKVINPQASTSPAAQPATVPAR